MGNPVYWALGTVLVAALVGGLVYGLATRKLGKHGPYIVSVIALMALWAAWPYWAIYDLQTAMVNGDKVRLASLVDWNSVRDGVREDLKVAYSKRTVVTDPRVQALSEVVRNAAIDRMVAEQITASSLSEMAKSGLRDANPMGQVRYAFFEGSPLVFRMDIGAEFSTEAERTIYLLEWNLGWRLKRIIVSPYSLGLDG